MTPLPVASQSNVAPSNAPLTDNATPPIAPLVAATRNSPTTQAFPARPVASRPLPTTPPAASLPNSSRLTMQAITTQAGHALPGTMHDSATLYSASPPRPAPRTTDSPGQLGSTPTPPAPPRRSSIFSEFHERAFPFRWRGTLAVRNIEGGTPSDPNVAEAWIKSKGFDKDDLIRDLVAKTMVERGITAEEASAEVATLKHLNGFKRDEVGLYIEGRQLKSAIKEAASVAAAAGKLDLRGWGKTNKGLLSFLAEHVFVVEERLHLEFAGAPLAKPTGINQRFVSTFRGTGIQYAEVVETAELHFHVISDSADFLKADVWPLIWLTGEQQGIGAARSQGFGRYDVVAWDREA